MTGTGEPIRLSIVGLGVVGRWVLEALQRDADRLGIQLVAVADSRSGLVHRPAGLSMAEILDAKRHDTLADLDEIERWPTALDGLREIDMDVLVEVSQSPADGQPGLSHIREALGRGIAVATSNKWPVATAGVELVELAQRNATQLRAESTVMSGTPVLSTLTEGIAGARPLRLRGVVNATANFICSRVAAGETYEGALQAAQEMGLAEPDPSADVDGHDSVSKLMVLAALVFGIQLTVADVTRRGLSELELRPGDRIREVMTLDPPAGRFSVEAGEVAHDDPLAGIDAARNSIVAEIDPIGVITITGPGAGRELAGQGVYSDLLRIIAGYRRALSAGSGNRAGVAHDQRGRLTCEGACGDASTRSGG
jgi:homoserine dehydrogenase